MENIWRHRRQRPGGKGLGRSIIFGTVVAVGVCCPRVGAGFCTAIEAPDASRGTPRRSGSRLPCQSVLPNGPESRRLRSGLLWRSRQAGADAGTAATARKNPRRLRSGLGEDVLPGPDSNSVPVSNTLTTEGLFPGAVRFSEPPPWRGTATGRGTGTGEPGETGQDRTGA